MSKESRPPEPSEPAVPPYEGRRESGKAHDFGSSGDPDANDQTASPAEEQPAAEQEGTRDHDHGVGPAHQPGTSRGEDAGEGSEAGRHDTGDDSGRPTGASTGRDATSVDPQDDDS